MARSRLNATERALVEKLGQKIFDWQRLMEEHFAVLRTDPNAYAEAWQEYAAKAPQITQSRPATSTRSTFCLESDFLKKNVLHSTITLKLQHACIPLSSSADAYHPVQVVGSIGNKGICPRSTHQYAPSHAIIPQNPHPLLKEFFGGRVANTSAASESPPPTNDSEYPVVLPGKPFSWSDILDYSRAPMLPADVACYKRNPGPLSRHTFTTTGDMGDEAFRVSSFLTIGEQKIFYVVYADAGTEAVSYSSSDFFTLLESSQRVIIPNSD
ncbi:hypothetical protein CPB85DRAFT_1557927 [Mucidula mucida]|nr:hypothetical protein CPB85DRAFT_1557927 [Mucidula mucida]